MRRVAYVTDLHLDEPFPLQHNVNARQNWEQIRSDIIQENISHLIIGGDIGEASAHPWFFDTLKDFSFQLTLGNHDLYADVIKQAPLAALSSVEHYFADEDAGFKYLFLDSSSDSVSWHQLQWLQDELRTEKSVVLFIHHPVLPVDTFVDRKHPLQNRSEVRTCLMNSERNITLFSGHYHLAHEQVAGNIRQYISPAVSFQMLKSAEQVLVDGSRYGYCIIEFNDDETIDTKVKLFESKRAQL